MVTPRIQMAHASGAPVRCDKTSIETDRRAGGGVRARAPKELTGKPCRNYECEATMRWGPSTRRAAVHQLQTVLLMYGMCHEYDR